MSILIVILVLILLIVGPQLWIRWIFYRYGRDLPSIPGTGAELARHLIERFEISDVIVEECEPNRDHFDSSTPAVRLSPKNYHGKSLTAVAVATHEVGHAIQWHKKETVFKLRTRYIPLANRLQQIGFTMLALSPIAGIVSRSPIVAAIPFVGGAMAALFGALTYLIMLPEEWDASFNKAMPILVDGDYISEKQQNAARKILRAAAYTYLAGALSSILRVWRWLPLILRR